MQITLYAFGKCRDKAILSQVEEYQKRLTRFWPLKVIELSPAHGSGAQVKEQEGKLLLSKISNDPLIVLDERGKQFTSQEFAKKLGNFEDAGHGHIQFAIGGADGFSNEVREKAALLLSLSKFTLAHMMVRPILAEQLYRAATIQSGHPYHRD
jgi:23S rRNA (pseudouridine1915-N3)-methyltransferase